MNSITPALVFLATVAMGSLTAATAPADDPIPLWSGPAPGALGTAAEDIPTITRFDPKPGAATGAAFVVCPGGGYGGLAPHEGTPVAEWLASLGITAFVLKYRLGPTYHHPVELGDALRAIRTVRFNSAQWGLDPKRIGILGFSAGGHLTSSTATHFDLGEAAAADPVDRVSSRPDLAVMVYPVISLQPPYGHAGSAENLLGKNPPQALLDLLSNEKQVTDSTPPCFLMHTSDDAVPAMNSLLFAEALARHHIPYELHVYQHGAHGYGLASGDPILKTWTHRCADWLKLNGFVKGSG